MYALLNNIVKCQDTVKSKSATTLHCHKYNKSSHLCITIQLQTEENKPMSNKRSQRRTASSVDSLPKHHDFTNSSVQLKDPFVQWQNSLHTNMFSRFLQSCAALLERRTKAAENNFAPFINSTGSWVHWAVFSLICLMPDCEVERRTLTWMPSVSYK